MLTSFFTNPPSSLRVAAALRLAAPCVPGRERVPAQPARRRRWPAELRLPPSPLAAASSCPPSRLDAVTGPPSCASRRRRSPPRPRPPCAPPRLHPAMRRQPLQVSGNSRFGPTPLFLFLEVRTGGKTLCSSSANEQWTDVQLLIHTRAGAALEHRHYTFPGLPFKICSGKKITNNFVMCSASYTADDLVPSVFDPVW
ncbi:hypothetical protein OsJ_26775 [Oryza sativa Japonica Group]|uniref:Uncharacterized protein n=1 Tax=Oryza sativa subsp. japonica TaxID=39947 RepID=B9G048_ORYSJ|nr:hypothetical protein OsJ_26775 [Oryza sativa Japonica Group]